MNNLMIAAVAAPVVAGVTAVGGYKMYQNSQQDQARIISVAEVTTVEKVPFERQECWQEKVVKVEERETEHEGWKAGATVAGAVVGGAIGNQIGDGRGKKLATVAGAAVGGKIAHDAYKAKHQPERIETQGYEQRCKTVTDYKEEERPGGFDVTYEYKGQIHTTHMDEAPKGDYLPIEVETEIKVKGKTEAEGDA